MIKITEIGFFFKVVSDPWIFGFLLVALVILIIAIIIMVGYNKMDN